MMLDPEDFMTKSHQEDHEIPESNQTKLEEEQLQKEVEDEEEIVDIELVDPTDIVVDMNTTIDNNDDVQMEESSPFTLEEGEDADTNRENEMHQEEIKSDDDNEKSNFDSQDMEIDLESNQRNHCSLKNRNPSSSADMQYNIIPFGAAIHPCSIHSMTSTRNMRWIFTGGDDGFVRKFDLEQTLKGDSSLTISQRHGLADSIILSGVLASAWENEETVPASVTITNDTSSSTENQLNTNPVEDANTAKIPTNGLLSGISTPILAPATIPTSTNSSNTVAKYSAVYSLDCQSHGVWLVSGLKSGAINLYTVRHDEGQIQHTFRKHQNSVSSLKICPEEVKLISGSWDKSILQWDLNTGDIVREFQEPTSQITSVSFQTHDQNEVVNSVSVFMATTFDGNVWIYDLRKSEGVVKKISIPDLPPWCLSASWSFDKRSIFVGRRNCLVHEIDWSSGKVIQDILIPKDSGSVTAVHALKNGRNLVCASHDNLRLWDLNADDNLKVNTDNLDVDTPLVPFSIIPGHHGGTISSILIDSDEKFMVSASGTRGYNGTSNQSCLLYEIQKESSVNLPSSSID